MPIDLFQTLVDGWTVITANWPLFMTAIALAIGGTSLWYRRQTNNAEREVRAVNAELRLKDAQMNELRIEAEKKGARIAELEKKTELSPADRVGFVSYGMQSAI